MDSRKYDVNVTVNIHHKGGYWTCGIRIIRILKVQQPEEYSYEQADKYESFFVLAFYFDEATLRHEHKQGCN